ncbi:GPI ethanolamine phosphate transferase [Grosmannia clavigera kw1407]|uniref:GPI ethanolamine phosphate transferase 2 n=1 Tax=Grosmannia clavigera (strain kw1407 / UAMH 11150) TaxID=655863 RepID=F0XPM6_GROCL|nr:GPI ethanolamine phosphate transferase [Grosmannia clavigera kw1407]EFX00445.1 GPI ethanolamine phosphate transferase [Grosmannia clavigera kw1407]
MAKSARASSRKLNNQKLKKNVFGPVEAARTERLSAKLMELVAQQLPVAKEVEGAKEAGAVEAVADSTPSAQLRDENTEGMDMNGPLQRSASCLANEAAAMDVDSAAARGTGAGTKRIVKRKVKKGSIVFRRYKDRSHRTICFLASIPLAAASARRALLYCHDGRAAGRTHASLGGPASGRGQCSYPALAGRSFGQGFFPYKPLLPGLAEYADLGYGPPAPAPFDRVIFMVVDALRSGEAVPFTALASSPTVTMPRLKALTTGSTPSFLDVVLNVDEGDRSSSLASQDTWLAQMRARQPDQKLLLYGDDTWLKLFPDTFDRADGTTSFFVSDFTDVDRNVTRHVAGELAAADWSVLVLHYLGLDHIGHKGGPHSPHMTAKQREMDDVVRLVCDALASEPHLAKTLLVLAGDHGMNEAGNHGASSAGETSPALLFVAPRLRVLAGDNDGRPARTSPLADRDDFHFYQTVDQADLAPTLAALLGFPAPRNSLGTLIPDFLPLWPQRRDRAHLLLQNAHQMLAVLTAAFGPTPFERRDDATDFRDCADPRSDDITRLGCSWQDIVRHSPGPEGDLDGEWTAQTIGWLRLAQSTMSGMASDYDLVKLGLGLAAATASVVLAVGSSVLLGSGRGGIAAVVTAWVATVGLRKLAANQKDVLPPVVAVVGALTAFRLVRAWNQTGQKFAGAPDVAKTFLQPQPQLLWALVGATYVLIGWRLAGSLCSSRSQAVVVMPAVVLLVALAFSFKLAFALEDSPELVGDAVRPLADLFRSTSTVVNASLVTRARIVFVGLSIATSVVVVAGRQAAIAAGLLHVYSLLAVTQSRPVNVPLFLLFDVVFRFLARQQAELAPAELTTASLLLQTASFFALGGTNAISSVDLSSAYNGITTFSAPAVGLLIFVSNWAAPIYWALAAVVLLLQQQKQSPALLWIRHVALLTVFAAGSTAAVMAACAAMRTHLFVWTVFSPKFLYCTAWSLGMHLGVNVALGGLLYGLGR